MKQLIAERDAQGWPGARNNAWRPKRAKRLGTRSIEVSGGLLSQEIRWILRQGHVIAPGRPDEVLLRFEHVIHERADRPTVTCRWRIKV